MNLLIESQGNYYDLSSQSYDTTSQSYTPLDNVNYTVKELLSSSTLLDISTLFTTTTIGTDTFIPIEKFDNFKIISNVDFITTINGVKSEYELIVMDSDKIFNSKKVRFVNYFTSVFYGYLKVVFSINGGTSWYTYNNGALSQTTYTVSDGDLFKDEIMQNGIDGSTLQNIDFQNLSFSQIRFACVIDRYTALRTITPYVTTANHLRVMKHDEYLLERYDFGIRLTSNINNPQMLINVFTKEQFAKGSTDERTALSAPTISLIPNGDDLNISWNDVTNADKYLIYINNETYETTNTTFTFPIGDALEYIIAVRAFPPNNTTLKASDYSNFEVYDNGTILVTGAGDYIAIIVGGKELYLRVN